MALSCLNNLIGIKPGCGLADPSSSFYINNLPGIDIELADKGSNKEFKGGIDLIQEKIDFAGEVLTQDITTFLTPYLKQNTMLQSETIGRFSEDMPLKAAKAGFYRGILIDMSDRNYLNINISQVRLFVNTAFTDNIYIIDLVEGKILDTVAVTTTANEYTVVTLNKTYYTGKQKMQLFIGIDAGLTGQYEAQLINGGCTECAGQGFKGGSFIAGEISKSGALIRDNYTAIAHTGGVSINYSLNCDAKPFVCNISNAIAMPLLYRAGAEIIDEALYSRRLNSLVTFHADDLNELRERYMAKYSELMESIMQTVKLPNDGLCFRCSPRIQNRVAIP